MPDMDKLVLIALISRLLGDVKRHGMDREDDDMQETARDINAHLEKMTGTSLGYDKMISLAMEK